MKINRPEIMNIINKIYKQEQVRGRAHTGEPANVSKVDRVEISAGSEALKRGMARLEGTDPVRLEKLTELTRQIESGEYKVDSGELAEIILRVMKEGP
ncbi:MAG: flagellar biosynthesis anti-sigma factor FlgM [Bacillota bacterium]|nr:flagellar biosynthesis anti-sigma factor FlgM [Bacillota bacterium]